MATNKVFDGTPSRNRDRALSLITAPTPAPTTIQPGVPVVFADGPAVSLTADASATKTETTVLPSGWTSLTYKNGGVGNATGHATFAFDGTYAFNVTGASAATTDATEVFIVPATGALTLTATSNTHYGWIDRSVGFVVNGTLVPVRIGK